MSIKLSHTHIESFCGNVLPLYLECDSDISKAQINWKTDNNDVIAIRSFEGDDAFSFNHGVLLTLMKAGHATVSAALDGEAYKCEISVREMRCAQPGDELIYFAGDLHDHTTKIHNHDDYAARESEFQIDYINSVKEDGRLDFSVISDHVIVNNDRDFFRGFTDIERAEPNDVVIIPGSEAVVDESGYNRFNLLHKTSGEIVVLNSNTYLFAPTWKDFYDGMAASPFAVCVLCHPYGISNFYPGVGGFALERNACPELRALINGVEMGNGGIRSGNAIFEYVYSLALDNGLCVSNTSSSDCHGPKWGYDVWPGKTVIMAYEKSKEAFLDALRARRFYGTESGNIKLRYSVNGHTAPCTLPLTDTYKFHIEVSYFHDDPTTTPTVCRVMSDYGRIIAEYRDVDFSSFDFEIKSDSARYFYLRFTDESKRRTWSVPVWTGRAFDEPQKTMPTPIDKTGFTVVELESGKDASVLVCDDPKKPWESELSSATYVIDMQKEQTFSAFGHYAPYEIRQELTKAGLQPHCAFVRFVSRYELSASSDGINYTKFYSSQMREFGGEEIIRFAKQKARYVKFRVISTAGAEWRDEFADAHIKIAELSLFK